MLCACSYCLLEVGGCEDGTEAARHRTLRRQHLQPPQLLHKAACHSLPSALTPVHATLNCPTPVLPQQVRHMVLVETDAQRAARLAAEAAAAAPRPPVRVRH